MRRLNGIVICAVITIAVALTFDASIALETSILKGLVTDVEGKAVKGAELFIYNSSDTRRPADFISGRTDARGRYKLAVPAGKWWAVARLRKGEKYGPLAAGDKHSGEPLEIELDTGEELEKDFNIVDIREAARLVKKTREDYFKLTGRIIDEKGKPAANVYAIAARGKDLPEIPAYVSAWTNEQGEYTLYLPAGKYFVGHASEFPPVLYRIAGEINIEGERNNYDIPVSTINKDLINGAGK